MNNIFQKPKLMLAVAAIFGMATTAFAGDIPGAADAKAGDIGRHESISDINQWLNPENGVYGLNTFASDANDWDSQFFIVFADEVVPAGTPIEVSFEYRKAEASGVVKFNAQGHADPHVYVNNDGWGELEATEEWQKYEASFETTGEIRTFAVNASIGRDNGILYMRNILITSNYEDVVVTKETSADVAEYVEYPLIPVVQPIDKDPLSEETNTNPTPQEPEEYTGDIPGAADAKTGDIGRHETNGRINEWLKPDNGVYGLHTFAADQNDWDSQFFLVFADELVPAGTPIYIKFEYRKAEGSGVVRFNAQGHANPHAYVNNDGWEALEATEEWQIFETDIDATGEIRTFGVNASIGRENGTLLLRNIVIEVNFEDAIMTKETTADFAIIKEVPVIEPEPEPIIPTPYTTVDYDKIGSSEMTASSLIYAAAAGNVFVPNAVKYGDDIVYALQTSTEAVNHWDVGFHVDFTSVSSTVNSKAILSFEYKDDYEVGGTMWWHNGGNNRHDGLAPWTGEAQIARGLDWNEFSDTLTAENVAAGLTQWEIQFGPDGKTPTHAYNSFIRNLVFSIDDKVVFSLNNAQSVVADAVVEHDTVTIGIVPTTNGTFDGFGTYKRGETATLVASPNKGYRFVCWNDGNTDNPRSYIANRNTILAATFDSDSATITIKSSAYGTFEGMGTYKKGDTVTIVATPNEGYQFVQWSDGITNNPRTFIIKSDNTVSAIFDIKYYSVSASANNKKYGNTFVERTYVAYNNSVLLIAAANKGFHFVDWSDGNTDAYRYLTVKNDTKLVANFAALPKADTIYITKTDTVYLQTAIKTAAVSKLNIYPNPTASFVTVNAENEFSYVLTNVSGRVLRKEDNQSSYMIDMSDFADGVYLLTTSDGITHKIIKK